MDVSLCLELVTLFNFIKKKKFELSQFSFIQLMVTVGLIFLVPQYFYERSIGLEIPINKFSIAILLYVVIFPAIAAYYCWQKAIELIGPNRSAIFVQLMPLFTALMAILIFKEKFQLYHFIGGIFIVSGIYLSNRKTQWLKLQCSMITKTLLVK